jgi:membrane-associated protease RseP (regulator of RpoE activity)
MKRRLFRCLAAAVLGILYSVPAMAAQLLIPVGEVVGLSLSEGTVTVAAFHEVCGAAAREAGVQIGDEIVSIDGKPVDSASDLYDALKCSDGTVAVEENLGVSRYKMRPHLYRYNPLDGDPATWPNGVPPKPVVEPVVPETPVPEIPAPEVSVPPEATIPTTANPETPPV